MGVRLRAMRDDEFERWLPVMRAAYAADIVENAGADAAKARAKAERDISQLFPDGRPSPAQLVYVIELDAERVGELWLSERDGDLQRSLWVFDIHIDESHRGRGLGRAAMLLAEDEARRRGLGRIGLNVFGGNKRARGLYRSLGYEEMAVTMGKTVQ